MYRGGCFLHMPPGTDKTEYMRKSLLVLPFLLLLSAGFSVAQEPLPRDTAAVKV